MPTALILEELIALPESPWGDLRGKALNPRMLANYLRQYSVRSKVIRVGSATLHGYAREDLHDAWKRYVPTSAICPASNETSATTATQADSGDTPAFDIGHIRSETSATDATHADTDAWES